MEGELAHARLRVAARHRASACSRWSSAPRACSVSSSKSPSGCCRCRAASSCCWPHSTTSAVAPTPSAADRGGHRARRSRDDGRAGDPRRDAFAHCGYPLDAAALLLCEIDGLERDVDDDLGRRARCCAQAAPRAVRVAADADERRRMWSGRKSAFPAVGRLAPTTTAWTARFRAGTSRQCSRGSRRCRTTTACGGQRLPRRRRQPAPADPVRRRTTPDELAARGALRRRRSSSCASTSAAPSPASTASASRSSARCARSSARAELAAFHAVKRAFDPAALLNPGKAVPTLARCADYGALRVHGGQLPHRAPAAVLIQHGPIPDCDLTDALVERVRRRLDQRHTAAHRRRRYARRGMGDRSTATALDSAATRGIVALRSRELVHHGSWRHATRRDSRQLLEPTANACHSSRRASATPARSAARSLQGSPVPRARRADPCATTCSARACSTGDGRVLRFGGEVMKNVAGYDVRACWRFARHARRHPRRVAEGAALARRRSPCSSTAMRPTLSIRSPLARYQRRRSRAVSGGRINSSFVWRAPRSP